MKRIYAALFIASFLPVLSAEAQTFSVALLEDVQGSEAPDYSNAVLDGCLDRLFAIGLIATNEAIGRVDKATFQTSAYGVQAARQGFVDYMALVWIRYIPYPGDPTLSMPETVLWRLVRIRDGRVLAEGSVPPPPFEVKSGTERQEVFIKFGRSLSGLWAKALKEDRG